MADRIIVKAGSEFTVKAGATVTSASGDPPYIISGLEQSHWLAENAVISNGTVESVPDVSGVDPLVVYNNNGFMRVGVSAAGWTHNGKTLPSFQLHDSSIYTANAWAAKLSGYTGPVTSAILIQPPFTMGGGGRFARLLDAYGADENDYPARGFGPIRNYASAEQGLRTGTNNSNFTYSANGNWSPSNTPVLIVVEYVGASAASNLGLYRLWKNGVEQTASFSGGAWVGFYGSAGDGGRSAATFSKFWAWRNWEPNTLIPQIHLWKGALTDAQRDDVTAYLKSISGIV